MFVFIAESGCADGSSEGVQESDAVRRGVAACDGRWTGHVDSASSSLCAAGWTVCGWNTVDLLQRSLGEDDITRLTGCYALNAAEHDQHCRPCRDNVTTLCR